VLLVCVISLVISLDVLFVISLDVLLVFFSAFFQRLSLGLSLGSPDFLSHSFRTDNNHEGYPRGFTFQAQWNLNHHNSRFESEQGHKAHIWVIILS
jgi:hypothetical protein